MKIFRAGKPGGKYTEAKDCGGLQSFAEVSLMTQIAALWLAEAATTVEPYLLVFSKEDQAQIAALANQLFDDEESCWGLSPELWAVYRLLMLLYPAHLGIPSHQRIGFFSGMEFAVIPPPTDEKQDLLSAIAYP